MKLYALALSLSALSAWALASCGGRTGLLVGDSAPGVLPPFPGDAAAATPPPPCVAWKVIAGPTAISSASEPLEVTTLLAGPSGPVVSWTDILDPASDLAYHARALGWDGTPVAADQALMTRSGSGEWSAPGLIVTASGFDAITWAAGDGCRFETLDGTAAPSSQPIVLGQSDCYMPLASPPGLSLLTSPDLMRQTTVSFETVDGNGAVGQTREIISTDAYVMSRVDLGDSTTGVLWASGMNPSALVYQRFSAAGMPLGVPATVAAAAYGSAMARAGGGLLVVYEDSSTFAIEVVPLDASGAAQSAPAVLDLGSSPTGSPDGFSITSIPAEDALLTWYFGNAGPGQVYAMSLSPAGVPRGPPSEIAQLPVVELESNTLAVVAPDGQHAVVATSAWLDPNGSEQAVTVGLECVQ